MRMADSADFILEGGHCHMHIRPLNPRVVVLHIVGQDRGEFGDKPFLELEALLRTSPYELFIDARDALSPGLDASGVWAAWLMRHRAQLVRVNMLTRQRFVQLTADSKISSIFLRRPG